MFYFRRDNVQIIRLLFIWIFFFQVISVADESALMLSDLGVSAESIAAGGIDGVIESASSLMENPALMGNDYRLSVDVFHTSLLQEMSYNTISISKPFGFFTLGLGYMTTSLSDIGQTAESSDGMFYVVDSYEYKLDQYYLGFSTKLNNELTVGFNAKYRMMTLYDVSGQGTSFDFGAKYKLSNVIFTGRVNNVVPSQGYMEYSNGSKEQFPFGVVFGARVSFLGFHPMLQYHYKFDDYNNSTGGLLSSGIKWSPFGGKYISLLAGYRQLRELSENSSRITMGVNLMLSDIKLSYAFEQTDRDFYNTSNYFSVGFFID